jgi:hypothetical protein
VQRRSTFVAEFGVGGITVAAKEAFGTGHGRIEIAMCRGVSALERVAFRSNFSRRIAYARSYPMHKRPPKTGIASSFCDFCERWSR